MDNSTLFPFNSTAPSSPSFSPFYDTPILSHVSSLNDLLHSHSHALLGSYHPQSIFASSYRSVQSSLTPYQMIVWVSFSLQVLYYLVFSLPSFLLPFLPFMQRYKIQQNRAPVALSEQWKVLRHVFTSKVCMILPIAVLGYEAFHYFHYDLPYAYESMQPWHLLTLQLVASLFIEDTWHYFMHRALHHPSVYGHVHKVHHTYAAPFSFAAEYAHPIETAILGVGFFIPLLLFFDHLSFFWLWLLVRQFETAEVHSGYDVPLLDAVNPLHLIPFYAGARFHDFHHKAFNTNYASSFYFWDRVLGTDGMYRKHNEELSRKQNKAE